MRARLSEGRMAGGSTIAQSGINGTVDVDQPIDGNFSSISQAGSGGSITVDQ